MKTHFKHKLCGFIQVIKNKIYLIALHYGLIPQCWWIQRWYLAVVVLSFPNCMAFLRISVFKLFICRLLKKVYQIWGSKMLIFKIRGTHLKPIVFETLYFQVSKKLCPQIFWKVFFLWALQVVQMKIWWIFSIFLHVRRKNFIFHLKIGLGQKTKCTNRFSGKNCVEICCLDTYVGKYFWRSCKTLIKVV